MSLLGKKVFRRPTGTVFEQCGHNSLDHFLNLLRIIVLRSKHTLLPSAYHNHRVERKGQTNE